MVFLPGRHVICLGAGSCLPLEAKVEDIADALHVGARATNVTILVLRALCAANAIAIARLS